MSKHYVCDYCEEELDNGRVTVVVTDASVEGLSDYGTYTRDVCPKCCTERLGILPEMKKGKSD